MVDELPEPIPVPKQKRCVALKDGDKLHYIVAHEEVKMIDGRRLLSPEVNVWWNNAPYKSLVDGRSYQQEMLVLRQENVRGDRADVVIVTLGQVYDLIDALTRAVENP